MCPPSRPWGPPDLSRRSLLKVTGAAGATLAFSTALGATGSAAGATRGNKRCYVLVVDGCRPGEINTTLTPTLAGLRAAGRNYPRAQSLPVMETIPNHVMMMTGVRPRRTGVPSNTIFDRTIGEVRTLDRPEDLKVITVIEQLNARGFTTGTVLSKDYLYGIFGERATHRWEPQPIVPVSGHAPDQFTMDAAIAMVENFDPNFMFINLGDVDRLGHSDSTGPSVKAARQAGLRATDAQVTRFIKVLKDSGRWDNAMVIVLADHSMDWSLPDSIINLHSVFEAKPLLAGKVAIADNGGADLLYWTGGKKNRKKARQKMRRLALATPGVLSVHRPADLSLGKEAGDLIAFCKSGWRFSDPEYFDNPIPGNHGHPATLPIPFFVSGGAGRVRAGTSSTARARTMDVAPTVAEFFKVGEPSSGYQGRSRL